MTVRPMSCISGDEHWAEVPKGGLLYSQIHMDKNFFWTMLGIRLMFLVFIGYFFFTQTGQSRNIMLALGALVCADIVWKIFRDGRKAFAPPRDPPTS